MNEISPEAVAVIRKATTYSEEAKEIAERLLSASSTTIENTNILEVARQFASKYSIDIPYNEDDKDSLINVLLKLIVKVSIEQENATTALFDEESFTDEELDSMDTQDMENDIELANLKAKFSSLITTSRFSEVLFVYSQPAQWDLIQPQYRKLFAEMLVDEAISQNEDDYPSFWHEFLK